ncbi:molybdopterin-dependent oxidoreductase [uncultured Desulfosarcina sp.]|uniref:molybdopterin-containing oxidoreductase family protein n=1 Tax=uncultured Desulfosarcina sp. TaxID=218289 RepID=UPI0029C6D173|nr:molybdopterin-dependent oxidoreductase [uncultured Desulfosarcina sp.]
MDGWHKTGCVLCAQNCGLEVKVAGNRMVKVRPDKANPRSLGYACRKGLNVAHHQHHADRLTHPLKRTANGFERISWDRAITEISQKLKTVVNEHGPRSYAYMGGGGQGCHFEAGFGRTLMKLLGSQYHYNAVAQELTGYFWACGRHTGRQTDFHIPDEPRADMLLAVGWNGMESHQMPRAPLVLKEFSRNPDKLLVVIDPRKSKTASLADIHLPVRPGADALMVRAMIAIILGNGWENRAYIESHTTGFDRIRPWFENFAVEEALAVCGLDVNPVVDLCHELGRRRWCLHTDLGIYMNRHSTLASCLYNLLLAVCGRLCVPGGNVIPGKFMPIGAHTDERGPQNWRTAATDFPILMGYSPPNVLPEEILGDHPDRIRSVIVCASNPLRSYADTTAYEKALDRLDLLVTIELAMTETARLSHYVLPARSGYESWDGTFFTWTWPEIYFQMRRPIIEPNGEPLECGEIFMRIADAMGLIPALPDAIYQAAKKDRFAFAVELMTLARSTPGLMKAIPFILSKTLGREMGSGNLAALWGLLFTAPGKLRKDALRAGFAEEGWGESIRSAPGRLPTIVKSMIRNRSLAPLAGLHPRANYGEKLFQAVMDHPEGLWLGKSDATANMSAIRTPSGRIDLHIPEMDAWIADLTPEREAAALAPDPDFPLILMAGRHVRTNANTLMRNPEWNQGRRACTLAINADDAVALGLVDGQQVSVFTAAGRETIELEVSSRTRAGQVVMPHGFGLNYQGRVTGANVNRLTKGTNRDPLAGTPLHRYVPCRVEAA